ncbi:hypothetical protein CK203_044605 [Vitis vinifera]|uniref:Integrase catalytic domain-containing protein n=1 Tax=Vitis vinifera TaxID=29760 RepID=A0A438HJL9_VITVI|nr:hypothetical protein CK203_044605 [Vitis vinifera]
MGWCEIRTREGVVRISHKLGAVVFRRSYLPHFSSNCTGLKRWIFDFLSFEMVSPKSSSGHEYILVAIDYFTKWVEAASYANLTAVKVASSSNHILSVDTRFLMSLSQIEGYISEAYRTSFRTSTRATPFSLVYGMEVVLPVKIEVGSLRIALEHQIAKTNWLRAKYDQLNYLMKRD